MALGDVTFARLLFGAGQMSKADFRRWFRFSRRLDRWDDVPANLIPGSLTEYQDAKRPKSA